MESGLQTGEAEIQSVAGLQHQAFKDSIVKDHGGQYSAELPTFMTGDGILNLAFLQWTDEYTQKEECHVAEVLEVLFDDSGAKAVKIGADPSGRQIFVYLNDPTLKAFGSIKLDPQTIQVAEDGRNNQTQQISAAATRSSETKRLRDVATNRVVKKLVTALAMTGTSVALMNTSPSGAAAGFNRDGTRSTISAPHVSHKPSKRPASSTLKQTNQPDFSVEVVTMKAGDTVIGLSDAAVNHHETNLSRREEATEDEILNRPAAKKFGSFHDMPDGTKIEIAVKPEPAPPTKVAQPHEQKPPVTERVLIKAHDTIFGFAFDRSRESGMSIKSEEAEILKLNPGIDVYNLRIGGSIILPELSKPESLPVQHVPSSGQKPLTAAQKIATTEFDKLAHELQIETWAGGSNAPIKQGDIVLFQDPQTHKFKVGTVEDIKGVGAQRQLTTDNGNCSVTQVLMRGDPYAETDQTQPKLVVVSPSPTLTPKPETPYWGINIDSTGNQTKPNSENLHNQIADGVSSDSSAQNDPVPSPVPSVAPVEWQNSNSTDNQPQPTPETSPNLNSNAVSSDVDTQTPPAPTPAPKPLATTPNSSTVTVEPLIDFSSSRPNLKGVVAAGYKGVIRYIGKPGEGRKLITKAEVAQDHAAGLAIGLVYEAGARDALGGYKAGVQAGRQAEADAEEIGFPAGDPIEIAVDFEPTAKQLPIIGEYIEGEESADKVYKAGVYGGKQVVTYLFNQGLVTSAMQTAAWSDDQWDDRAEFRQIKNHAKVAGGTVDIDKDMDGLAGLWLAPEKPVKSIAGKPIPATTSPKPTPAPKPSVKTPTTTPNGAQALPGPGATHSFTVSPSNIDNQPNAPQPDTNTQIYDFFINNGFTASAAAGIAANANAESGSQPERLEGTPSGEKNPINSLTENQLSNPQIGFGIFQFTPPEKLVSWANAANLDPNSLVTQCQYVLSGMEASLIQELNAAPNASAAAQLFEKDYERPASLNDAPRRGRIAQQIYTKMNSAASSSSAITR